MSKKSKKTEGPILQSIGAPLDRFADGQKPDFGVRTPGVVPAVGRKAEEPKKQKAPGWDWFDPVPKNESVVPEKRTATYSTTPASSDKKDRAAKQTLAGFPWEIIGKRAKPVRKKSATKKKILDSALKEFSGKGFYGARMEKIADRAGCNKALIHYYFKDKSTLYRRTLASLLTATFDRLTSFSEENPEPLKMIEELVNILLGPGSLSPDRMMLIQRELTGGGKVLNEILAETARAGQSPANRPLTKLFETLKRELVPEIKPHHFIASIIGMCLATSLVHPLALAAGRRDSRESLMSERRSQIIKLIRRGAFKNA